MTMAPHPDQAAIQEPSADADLALNISQLIRELDDAFDYFPEETLRACQKHRQLVTPALIDVLQDAARVGQDGTVREGNAPIFALYLLAEFQAREALPALVAFLTLPNDVPDALLGDAITEDLPRILAILAGDHDDLLDQLIGNETLNGYVRSAAIRVFEYLVRDGHIERSAAVARLREYLKRMLAKGDDPSEDDSHLAGCLVDSLASINGYEAKSEIQEAFERDIVDTWYCQESEIEEALHPDQPDSCPELDGLQATKIEDTVEELRGWQWDEDEDDLEEPPEPLDGNLFRSLLDRLTNSLLPELPTDDFDDEPFPRPTAIRHEAPRVGRNEPCPCGSGKKYKKCCLRQHSE